MEKYHEYMYLEMLNKNVGVEKKSEAIKNLGKMKSISAVPNLKSIAVNKECSMGMRTAAILSLAEIGDKSFLSSFLPFISIEEEDIMEVVIIAAGKLNATEYIGELGKFSTYGDTEVKINAVETLSKIGNEKAIKTMLMFYNERDLEVKAKVKILIRDSNTFMDYIDNASDEEVLNVIGIVPQKKAEKLIDKLSKSTKDSKIMKILVMAVGELKLENGLQLLKSIYNEFNDKDIRLKIIETIQNIYGTEKKEFLFNLYETDEDRDIRTKIVFALGAIRNDDEVEEFLLNIVKNRENWWMLRKISVMILCDISRNKFVDEYIGLLSEGEDIRVVRTIIQELGEIGNINCIKHIEKYLETEEQELKKTIILSMAKLGEKKIIERLIEDKNLREKLMPESLKAIMQFNDSRIIDICVDILNSRKENMVDLAIEALSEVKDNKIKNSLICLINDNKVRRETRAKAFMVLANYRDKDTTKIVKGILDSEDEWWMLKKLAIIIAGELNLYELIEIIIKYSSDIDERIAKNSYDVAKKFYEEYFLEELEKEKSKMYNTAREYLKIL